MWRRDEHFEYTSPQEIIVDSKTLQKSCSITKEWYYNNVRYNKHNKNLIAMNSLLSHEPTETLVHALTKKAQEELESLREGSGEKGTIFQDD